jgi:hypothetical protein
MLLLSTTVKTLRWYHGGALKNIVASCVTMMNIKKAFKNNTEWNTLD